jgi:hypothetical protein
MTTMAPTPLWIFAHFALSGEFHREPARFVATLDGNAAPAFLEHMWSWALSSAGAVQPARPPLRYGIDRPRPGLTVVWMAFDGVTATGEPWHIRFIVRDPDAGGAGGYRRMFLLEHSEQATEICGVPTAIACESDADGTHRNWGATLAPTDEAGFDDLVVAILRSGAPPTASTRPG